MPIRTLAIRRLVLGTLLIAACVTLGEAQEQGLRGDPEAIAMARTMIQQLGGIKQWSEATALYIVEEVHRPNLKLPYRSQTWRNFAEPAIWYRSDSTEVRRSFARTRTQGWNLTDGKLTRLNDRELQQWAGSWARNIYVMFHRLAREDSQLRLTKEQARRFAVFDETTGEKLCTFEVTVGGAVLRWSAFGTDAEEWIYGPLTDFGPLRMPSWGVRLQDSYRFYYREVTLSRAPPPVSFDAPSTSKPAQVCDRFLERLERARRREGHGQQWQKNLIVRRVTTPDVFGFRPQWRSSPRQPYLLLRC